MLTASKNKIFAILIALLISNFFLTSSSHALIDLTVGGQFAIDKDDQIKRFDHTALDSLSMIDFFLCVMKVRADLFPNANYKAQVNEAACDRLAGNSDENAPKVKMADITLSCTRASNSSPQICKTWYNLSGENITYLVKVQMDAEPTVAKPNGLFTFSWCMADSTDGTCKASNLSYGQLSLTSDASGNTVVQMYDEYGGTFFNQVCNGGPNPCKDDASPQNTISSPVSIADKIKLTLSSHKLDSATGSVVQIIDSYVAGPPAHELIPINNPTTFNLSFDEDHGLIKDPTESPTDACFPLTDPTAMKEYVHKYDLYERSTGNLKAVGGGIPITVASVAANSTAQVNDQGWWDYWGLHINGLHSSGSAYEPKKLTPSSTVTAQADSTAVGIAKGDTLTVNSAKGVLRTETSYTGTFDNNHPDTKQAETTMYQWTPLNGQTYLYFDVSGGMNAVKVKTAVAGYSFAGLNGGNPVAVNTDVTDQVDWCSGQASVADYCFGAHSQAIGGWFNISDISAGQYTAYVSERIIPGATGFTQDVYLKCYGDRCLKPMDSGALNTNGFGATDFKNANGSSTYNYSFIDPNGGTPKYYMFDVSEMTLKHCATWNGGSSSCTGDLYPVICATDEGSDKCDNTDWSGSAHLHVSMVKHDVSVSDWNDINSATRYIWNTSNNVYGDRLTWPSKAGSTISFNPPINFAYDHETANDRNGTALYNGKKFGLEYGGNGNLWGIDWDQVDPTCSGMDCDYQPQISIEDGVVVDLGASEGGQHVILARRMDLKPTALGSTATCTNKGLDVSSAATMPSLPSIESIIDFNKGEEPTGASLISTEVCVVDDVLTGAAGCPTE